MGQLTGEIYTYHTYHNCCGRSSLGTHRMISVDFSDSRHYKYLYFLDDGQESFVLFS
jgi:hypothetical protein